MSIIQESHNWPSTPRDLELLAQKWWLEPRGGCNCPGEQRQNLEQNPEALQPSEAERPGEKTEREQPQEEEKLEKVVAGKPRTLEDNSINTRVAKAMSSEWSLDRQQVGGVTAALVVCVWVGVEGEVARRK